MLTGRPKAQSKKYRQSVLSELHHLMNLAEHNGKTISKIILTESAYQCVQPHVQLDGTRHMLFGHEVEMRPDITLTLEENADGTELSQS